MKIRGIKGFCRANNIELLILFGSGVTGKTHPSSDIDIAVKLKKGVGIQKLELIYKLDDVFNGKSIDLVVLGPDTDPLLLHEIFFNGTPVYEKKDGMYKQDKLRSWKLYLDTEKIREVNE